MQQLIDIRRKAGAFMTGAIMAGVFSLAHADPQIIAPSSNHANIRELGQQLAVGDVVFIQIPLLPFKKVADTTSSWANHVGIVTDVSGAEPLIAESRVPLSGSTAWSRFVKRSGAGRVAVARLRTPLDAQQQARLQQAVAARRNILYDTGFNLHSQRQFCSRYVREVVDEATGIKLGEVEDFATLLQRNPQADQRFWRMWYFGSIPWQRETVTPASLLRDARLLVFFDGYAQ